MDTVFGSVSMQKAPWMKFRRRPAIARHRQFKTMGLQNNEFAPANYFSGAGKRMLVASVIQFAFSPVMLRPRMTSIENRSIGRQRNPT